MLTQEMIDIRNQTEKDFFYKPDPKFDVWKIHRNAGTFSGDCEDFALTLLYRLSNNSLYEFWFNLLTFRAVLWFCKSPSGEGHLVLWYRGNWADNTMKSWYTKPSMPHTLLFPLLWPLVVVKLVMGKIYHLLQRPTL